MSSTAPRPSARPSRSASSIPDWVPRAAPFAAFIFLIAVQPALAGLVDPRWVTIARGLVAAALLALFWSAYRELRDAPAATARQWIVAIAAGAGIAVLWIVLDASWAHMGGGGPGFRPLRADGTVDPLLLALRLFGFVLVVPLMEELFWRSFLMRWIDRRDFLSVDPRNASLLAVGLSSAVFALEHDAWAAGLVAGLAYGMIYRWTGNLRTAIVSHAVSNAILGGWIIENNDWSLW